MSYLKNKRKNVIKLQNDFKQILSLRPLSELTVIYTSYNTETLLHSVNSL